MLFNSLEFFFFFPLVTLVFFLLSHQYRWMHLLLASCVFYMFFVPEYILILLITILIDFVAGIYIEKAEGKKRKGYLVVSVVSTCLVLFVFKYFGFFNENLHWLSEKLGFSYPNRQFDILLPIGLSFHTFQSLSYVIEVYRGNQKAERHFGLYSLYVLFYPQLVTGPIERPQSLLRQIHEVQTFQWQNLIDGLRLILFGFFVKMVIADNLAPIVDTVYNSPENLHSGAILKGIFFYSFQIYCDFLGYSTIAVGCAKAMGFSIMDNFKNPYLAQSIGEFWQRWHISLSTWFRDYVYFSLGGNKVKVSRWILNILIVFVVSGFWHGANWTFIIWGFLHGLLYLVEAVFYKKFPKLGDSAKGILRYFKIGLTFVLVSFIWVFFRAKDWAQAKLVFKSLLKNWHVPSDVEIPTSVWYFLLGFILLDTLLFQSRFDKWCSTIQWPVRWSIYFALLFLTIAFSGVENYPFIYFQF
ncbi:MAG: MBOAT family O-acyltransferase [Crocinitomicaceae bacterium]